MAGSEQFDPAFPHKAPMKHLNLEDIADVETGYPFRGKLEDDPSGDIRVIQAKDIRADMTFDPERLTRIRSKAKSRFGKKLVNQGDVIYMTRTAHPYAAYIPMQLPDTVVQNSFATLRLRSPGDVLPEFLAMLLNQSLMRSRITACIRGATVPYVQLGDLKKLKLPLPSLDRQKALVGLETAMRHEESLNRQLEQARKEQLDALILSE